MKCDQRHRRNSCTQGPTKTKNLTAMSCFVCRSQRTEKSPQKITGAHRKCSLLGRMIDHMFLI